MSLAASVFGRGKLVLDHTLGNVARIAALREDFESATGDVFPQESDDWLSMRFGLIAFTIRSGVHCGDGINRDDVSRLKRELLTVPRGTDRLEIFRAQMLELCDAALKLKAYILFT